MFHPHGPQPPSVYWRRRFVVIATAVLLLLLIVLTVHAMTSGATGRPDAAGRSPSTHANRTNHSPSHSATAQQLELGKTDLALLAGDVASPAGFEPAVTMTVGDGWTSVHRYADAFDLGRPDPEQDRPLVVVAVTSPP